MRRAAGYLIAILFCTLYILSTTVYTVVSLGQAPVQHPGTGVCFFPRYPQIQFHYLSLFLHEKDSLAQSFRAPYTLSQAPVCTVASPELASVFVPRAGASSFLAPHFLVGYNEVRMETFSHGDSCR